MAQLRLTVQTITPLLMYGAHNKDDRTNRSLEAVPELRAASFRGVLRYWLRAVLGGRYSSTSDLYEAESAILGSTDTGSRVKVRVYPSQSMHEKESLTVLPRQTNNYPLLHTGYPAKSQFRIVLSTHLLDNSAVLNEDGDLLKAVFLMVYMGGLGRRSRRGSGDLRVLDVKGYEGNPPLAVLPDDREMLVRHLKNICHYVSPPSRTLGRRPSFPAFASDTAVVLVGKTAYPDYEKAFDELWRVSGPYHHEEGIFGSVRPRRASAIHMRVAATNAGYVSQQTILYSGNGQWQLMKQYIDACLRSGFDAVYGTWGHWRNE